MIAPRATGRLGSPPGRLGRAPQGPGGARSGRRRAPGPAGGPRAGRAELRGRSGLTPPGARGDRLGPDQEPRTHDHRTPAHDTCPRLPRLLRWSSTWPGARCLVVGGGPVAARRAGGLLASGARVTVVAPQVVAALETMADDPARPAHRVARRRGHGDRLAPPGTLEIVRRPLPGRGGGPLPPGGHGHRRPGGRPAGRRRRGRRPVCPSTAPTATAGIVPASRRPPGRAGRGGRLHRRWQPGPGPVAPGPGRRLPPPGAGIVAGLLEEARAAVRRSGRPTGSVDWERAIPWPGARWSNPAGSTRPGPRLLACAAGTPRERWCRPGARSIG